MNCPIWTDGNTREHGWKFGAMTVFDPKAGQSPAAIGAMSQGTYFPKAIVLTVWIPCPALFESVLWGLISVHDKRLIHHDGRMLERNQGVGMTEMQLPESPWFLWSISSHLESISVDQQSRLMHVKAAELAGWQKGRENGYLCGVMPAIVSCLSSRNHLNNSWKRVDVMDCAALFWQEMPKRSCINAQSWGWNESDIKMSHLMRFSLPNEMGE